MKKLLLSLLFCSTMLFSFSQFTVTNYTSVTINVGVQTTPSYGSCTALTSFAPVPISAFSSYTFPTPPGSLILRVGYWGATGTAWEYAPCGGCTATSSPAGPYGFWGYTCSSVAIR